MVGRCVHIDVRNPFVANHRAVRHSASHSGTTDGSDLASLAPATPSTGGKRKAVKPSRAARRASTRSRSKRDLTPAPAAAARTATRSASTRDSSRVAARTAARPPKGIFALLPSAPTAVGAAALVIAATGAVTVTGGSQELAAADSTKMFTPASAMTGTSDGLSSLEMKDRTQAVSRDSQRGALDDATDEDLQQAVEAQAQQRNAALAELAASAEQYAGEIAANAWHLPMAGYHLTAGFGESSGLWASTHTGLDFAGPTGTPAVAVANGTVRSVEYAGAYGNRVVLALEDGTEIWYCHLSAFSVGVGDSVTGGEQVGLVGATGNVTGPHLHIEVRPGAGDPVDPYAAFVAHGITP
jgi:murein DD-endopeptidase MepM/ murein hydrolase activator NlpD